VYFANMVVYSNTFWAGLRVKDLPPPGTVYESSVRIT